VTLKGLNIIYPGQSLYGIDFTPFTQKGFLITPEKYEGFYESVGIIDFTAKPGAQYKLTGEIKNPEYFPGMQDHSPFIEHYEWVVDSISFKDVLTKVYDICTQMGADALVNFHNELISDNYSGIKNPTAITGYRITGFAIKRKNK